MDEKKIVVIVEDIQVSKTALEWALNNLLRYGDTITLLHVFPLSSSSSSKSKKKARLLRLNGFQLALSFQAICNSFPNTKVEIIVTEGDQEGRKIVALVREIGASMLVVGLHDNSFLYKLAMTHSEIGSRLSCRVLAIKQPLPSSSSIFTTNFDFSQIDLSQLQLPEIPTPRIPYRVCPSPSRIIWRSRKSRIKST